MKVFRQCECLRYYLSLIPTTFMKQHNMATSRDALRLCSNVTYSSWLRGEGTSPRLRCKCVWCTKSVRKPDFSFGFWWAPQSWELCELAELGGSSSAMTFWLTPGWWSSPCIARLNGLRAVRLLSSLCPPRIWHTWWQCHHVITVTARTPCIRSGCCCVRYCTKNEKKPFSNMINAH